MSFLFPEAWYLLPLVVMPWVINLYRYLRGQTVAVPSVFFLEKLLQKKILVSNTNRWLEMLVESVFLLGLITLLSKPVFAEPVLSNNRLLVLLDDSPSMQYHYLDSQKGIFKDLSKWLAEDTYEQIAILPLSALNKKEPLVFQGPQELGTFYEYFYEYLTSAKIARRAWNIAELKTFMVKQIENNQFEEYDYIIYTDAKANHFKKSLAEDNTLINFPKIINISTLPPAPTIEKIELDREHYFVGEIIELGLEVKFLESIPSAGVADELVLEVHLDNTLMYRKQIVASVEIELIRTRFPATLSKEKQSPSAKAKILVSPQATQLLTITLAKNQQPQKPFILLNRIINVYPPKTITFLPPNHQHVNFFETLFAYDLERGHLAITPQVHGADVNIALDPAMLTATKYNPKDNYLIFLNPNESPLVVNQLLKNWGFNNFLVDNKKTVNVLDVLETPFVAGSKSLPASQYGILNYFGFDFTSTAPTTTISGRAGLESLLIMVTIQKQPFIFRYQNVGVFNGLGLDQMVTAVNPDHLVWMYEMLFSFFGGKKLISLESEVGVVNWFDYSPGISNTQNASGNGAKLFDESVRLDNSKNVKNIETYTASATEGENLFYYPVSSPAMEEFAGTVFTEWDTVFSQTAGFQLPQKNQINNSSPAGITQSNNVTANVITDTNLAPISVEQSYTGLSGLFKYMLETTDGFTALIIGLEILLLLVIAYWLGKRTTIKL